MSIRERGILRHAYWRKIEIEFESQLALEFESAGIINPSDDPTDWMDPLHKVDYQAWKAGKILPDGIVHGVDFDEVRRACIEDSVSSIILSIKVNPLKSQTRQMLLQPKYTELSTF